MLALDAKSFAAIEGSTDSEVLFHLALAHGLERDPVTALQAAIGFAEKTLRRNSIVPALQASIGISDGETLWALRYSTEGRSRSLFHSTDVDTLKMLHPDNPRLQMLQEGDRLVVSEPLADLPGAWEEIPESTALVITRGGAYETSPFTPG